MTQEKIEVQNLQEIIFDRLKGEILDGTLKPGDPINAVDTANRFGISRTPVREAISKLEAIALVEKVPRCGYKVAGFSITEVLETYYLRASMEGMAASMAAKNFTAEQREQLREICRRSQDTLKYGDHKDFLELNTQMHELIYSAIQTTSIRELLHRYRDITKRYAALGVELTGRNEQLSEEHQNLVDAIVRADSEQAEYWAKRHLISTAKSIANNWKDVQ